MSFAPVCESVLDGNKNNTCSNASRQDGLYLRSSEVRVDFYAEEQSYLEICILYTGDVVFLAYGGQGFEMLEASEIIEVKQGPYAGDEDKRRFEQVPAQELRIVRDGE